MLDSTLDKDRENYQQDKLYDPTLTKAFSNENQMKETHLNNQASKPVFPISEENIIMYCLRCDENHMLKPLSYL